MRMDQEKREKIDRLLQLNASYQAQETCVTNTRERIQEINNHCRENFIDPIKEIDEVFWSALK